MQTANPARTWNISPDYQGQVWHDTGVVLMRGDQEIEYFSSRKEAGAYALHTYGCRIRSKEGEAMGLSLAPLNKRGPRAGDAATYRGGGNAGYGYLLTPSHGKDTKLESVLGILDHSYGSDSFGICFGASAYREGARVSCSGGPIPCVQASSLTFIGFRRTMFWRWHNGYQGAGEGGNYWLNVPHWEWDGNRAE